MQATLFWACTVALKRLRRFAHAQNDLILTAADATELDLAAAPCRICAACSRQTSWRRRAQNCRFWLPPDPQMVVHHLGLLAAVQLSGTRPEASRSLQYHRAAVPAGQFPVIPTVRLPSRSWKPGAGGQLHPRPGHPRPARRRQRREDQTQSRANSRDDMLLPITRRGHHSGRGQNSGDHTQRSTERTAASAPRSSTAWSPPSCRWPSSALAFPSSWPPAGELHRPQAGPFRRQRLTMLLD
jgi:hypothetical protein